MTVMRRDEIGQRGRAGGIEEGAADARDRREENEGRERVSDANAKEASGTHEAADGDGGPRAKPIAKDAANEVEPLLRELTNGENEPNGGCGEAEATSEVNGKQRDEDRKPEVHDQRITEEYDETDATLPRRDFAAEGMLAREAQWEVHSRSAW